MKLFFLTDEAFLYMIEAFPNHCRSFFENDGNFFCFFVFATTTSFFCCNRQPQKLHPVDNFATMTTAGCSGKLFFAGSDKLFCYNRYRFLLEPARASGGHTARYNATTTTAAAVGGRRYRRCGHVPRSRSCKPATTSACCCMHEADEKRRRRGRRPAVTDGEGCDQRRVWRPAAVLQGFATSVIHGYCWRRRCFVFPSAVWLNPFNWKENDSRSDG